MMSRVPKFAANLSMLFNEVPFLDRFAATAQAGFRAVEFLFPYEHPPEAIAGKLRENNLQLVLFNMPPGDWAAGDRGTACIPGREAEFRAGIDRALTYALTLQAPRIHGMAGIAPAGADRAACRETLIANLRYAARKLAPHNITLLLEAINHRDIPGFFINRQAESFEIVEAVGEPNLKMQMDLYHMQIMEGDIATKLRKYALPSAGFCGHIQIAGAPQRNEPDTGELRYEYIFQFLDEIGYDGWVGCEYRPAGVPLPNGPAGLYTFASNQTFDDNNVVAKIDHVLSDKNRLSGRVLYNNNDSNQSVNNTTLPGYLALIKYRNWNFAVTDTYLMSPHLVNTFTFGFNNIRRDQVPITPNNQGWTEWGAGFKRAAPDDPEVGFDTTVSGYFHPQSRYPLHHYRKSLQFTEGLNWTVGSHFLKFGADVRRNVLSLQENFETDAQVTVSATNTGNAASDLLLGYLGSFVQIAPDSNRPRNNELGTYAQDDWKAARGLTLNIGVRWDPFFPYSDPDGRFGQVRLGQQSTRFPAAPLGDVFSWDPGVPNATLRNEYGDWGPRFGFAYDPFGKGRTSIRGGYGMFYSQARQQANNQVSNNQPFSIKLTGTNPKGGLLNPYSDTGNPFPFHAPATPAEIAAYKFILPLNMTQWNPDFRNARAQQWNMTLQHQFGATWVVQGAYVGAKSNHLFMSTELNPAVFGAPGNTVDARRRLYPSFSTITDMNSAANSTYHAMQLTLNKRMSKGLTILSSYTWSKSLDNASGDDNKPSNPYRFSNDKGPSNNDIPHRFVASFIYDLPHLRQRGKLLRQAIGGWTINGIATAQSLTPFTVVSGRDNSGTGINNDRADVIGDWYVDNSDRSKNDWIAKYFNTAAFGPNKVGTFGNAGRNILRGPMRQGLDLGLLKTFPLTERKRVQFRAETFNALNHANFGNPNGNQSAGNFGRITTAATPRIMQLALKLMF